MPRFDDVKRSRFKLTIITMVILVLLSVFPMYVILKAVEAQLFELVAAWTAWGLCITGVGTVAGYYLNKETQRPSLIGHIGNIMNSRTKNIELEEDFSDPEKIPL